MSESDVKRLFHAALQASKLNWSELYGQGFGAYLAKEAGVSPGYISQLLNGEKDPSEEVRRSIAAALNYRYEDFIRYGRLCRDKDEPASFGRRVAVANLKANLKRRPEPDMEMVIESASTTNGTTIYTRFGYAWKNGDCYEMQVDFLPFQEPDDGDSDWKPMGRFIMRPIKK